MSLLIADETVGTSKGIPYAIPYSSIERLEIEEVEGEFTVVVYTLGGTRKVVKARFSFDRCVELFEKIAEGMKDNDPCDLI